MKKSIRNILIILTLIALLIPITYVYAIEKPENTVEEKTFFEIAKTEVTKDEKIEMTINLNEISYKKFVFELQSSENIENIEIKEKEKNNDEKAVELEKRINEISIEIDKETTNLSTITLHYQIPEAVQINDTIKFVATIKNSESDENEDIDVESIENEETQTVEIEVKVIETKENTNNQEKIEEKPNTSNQEEIGESQNINNNKENIQTVGISSQIIGTYTTSTSVQRTTEQAITYNGSDNNYLSKLSVDNYTLDKEFSKEKSTYFLTVENDISSLNITATAEESSATVCIYGNENLIEGTNKILISVTAENGNVRNYRIYVIKNS